VATVVFDFDSTLITCESLDEMLARVLDGRPHDAARVRALTNAGMEGRISFCDALEQRLAIAKPSHAQAEAFGREAVELLTPGMAELVAGLGADVWIVSGGLREVLLPVAAHLGLAADRVLGTCALWSPDGALAGIDHCREKTDLAAAAAAGWTTPRVGVGDGMSDYALLGAGHVDHFVAFTAHVRRAPVVATGAPEARSVRELEYLLAELL